MTATMQQGATSQPNPGQTAPLQVAAQPAKGGIFRGGWIVFRRELASYFSTPVAYIFLAVYLLLTNGLTWFFFDLYEGNQADLQRFFDLQPLVSLALIPALAMRLWAEERHSGTIEMLLTLPVTPAGAVVGKFCAAWVFVGVALILTGTNWVTLEYLGDPDHGALAAGYIGCFLLTGAYLAISSAISSMTKNQIVAFVLSFAACLGLFLLSFARMLAGADSLPGPLQQGVDILEPVLSFIASFGVRDYFSRMTQGLIDIRDVIYFLSLIALSLLVNVYMVEKKKAS